MNRKNKHLIHKKKAGKWQLLPFVLAFVFVGAIAIITSFASSAGARLYISPSSGSAYKGQTITSDVKVDNQSNKNAKSVVVDITFPAQLLKVESINTQNSDFQKTVSQSVDNSAGTIELSRKNNSSNGVGVLEVARIVYKTRASGTAHINIDGNHSKVKTSSSNILKSISNATRGSTGKGFAARPSAGGLATLSANRTPP